MLSLPIGWMKFHFPKLGLQLDTWTELGSRF
jgi:hypothetical protein